MVKSFTSRSRFTQAPRSPQLKPGFHCCHGCGECWFGWDARIWVEICGLSFRDDVIFRLTAFYADGNLYVKGFLLAVNMWKLDLLLEGFEWPNDVIVQCLTNIEVLFWIVYFINSSIFGVRQAFLVEIYEPIGLFMTFWHIICSDVYVCVYCIHIYIPIYMHIDTILCTIFTLTRIWLCMLYHISANWTNNFQMSGCLLASPYPFSKVDHQDISWKKTLIGRTFNHLLSLESVLVCNSDPFEL